MLMQGVTPLGGGKLGVKPKLTNIGQYCTAQAPLDPYICSMLIQFVSVPFLASGYLQTYVCGPAKRLTDALARQLSYTCFQNYSAMISACVSLLYSSCGHMGAFREICGPWGTIGGNAGKIFTECFSEKPNVSPNVSPKNRYRKSFPGFLQKTFYASVVALCGHLGIFEGPWGNARGPEGKCSHE